MCTELSSALDVRMTLCKKCKYNWKKIRKIIISSHSLEEDGIDDENNKREKGGNEMIKFKF